MEYINYKAISKYKFYQDTGFSNGFLDKSGSVGSEKCEKISYCYPDLDLVWLITGRGEMLKSGEKDQNNIIQSGKNNMNIANSGTFLKSGDIPDKLEEKKECDLCKEKDKVIKSLEKQIELLERMAKMEDRE